MAVLLKCKMHMKLTFPNYAPLEISLYCVRSPPDGSMFITY